jgi:hypothetical protein
MAKVVNLLHYKFGRMDMESLMWEAECHARLMQKGMLTPLEKYRSRVVFTATFHKAETEEVRTLMRSLLKVINYM